MQKPQHLHLEPTDNGDGYDGSGTSISYEQIAFSYCMIGIDVSKRISRWERQNVTECHESNRFQ
jgi:hypothetical protein